MKRGDCEFPFSSNTMAYKWMNNRSMLLSLSGLEGINAIYQFRGEKRVQRRSLRFLSLRLSSFTIAAWVELILWTSVLLHIVWIESYLLDFTSAFSLIWWISYVSIVTSFITWIILTNKIVSPWLQGCCQCRDHLGGRTNLNRLIIMEDIYQITKRCENDARTVQWRVKKIEHSSSVWLVTFHYA